MNILMLNELSSTFVKNDLRILRECGFNVDVLSSPNQIGYFKQIKKANRYDVYFSWWTSSLYTVIFSKFFRGKSIIVAGGGDVAFVPEINYGAFCNRKKALLTKFVVEHANIILSVSEFTRNEVLKRGNPRRVKTVYNGIDIKKYRPRRKRENIVLTVAKISKANVIRKGLEIFVKTAKLLPDLRFVLVGKDRDNSVRFLKRLAPCNVEFTGYISEKELNELYERAKIYVQLSYYESFGVALAEAMSGGCIPIVTRRSALPEVVGNSGFYVPYGNVSLTAQTIKEALSTDKGQNPRNRIKSLFSLAKRKEQLKKAFINVLK